jgi:hypothetical protein
MNASQYEIDFYQWTYSQADLLRHRQLDKLDIDNLIEEIETLGRSNKRSLQSQLERLLKHLLKKEYQADMHTTSWDLSIRNAKREILNLIKHSPSLKNELIKMFEEIYEEARFDASEETYLDISKFPKTLPWTIEELFPELYNEKQS